MLYQLIRLILSEQRSDSVPDFKLFGLKLRKAEWCILFPETEDGQCHIHQDHEALQSGHLMPVKAYEKSQGNKD